MDKLHIEELAQYPVEASKSIEELRRNCVRYTEELTKNLLILDEIVISQESRPLRKAQVWKLLVVIISKVTTVQHSIDHLDRIQQKLETIIDSLKQEEKVKEEQRSKKGPSKIKIEPKKKAKRGRIYV